MSGRNLKKGAHMADAIQGPTVPRQFADYLFEIALDGALVTDASGRIVAANPAACRMFGRSREELSKLGAADLADPCDKHTSWLIKERTERGWAQGETTLVRADGSHFIAMTTSTAFRDVNGTLMNISVIRDISAIKRLEAEFHATVQSIGKLVEARDPYTAGHDRRVADIAEQIGKELELPAEQLEGLHLTGFIHDVGKIGVPAEILSKPTRLDEVELALVRRHPRTGYEVLKTVDFRWPVAQTVLQHHERLDGSGYPQGLKGDSILLEARILSVADVIEAMASHRPYRPGLGIDSALSEIKRGQGSLYDARAVGACLSLFQTKGYQLPA
jgi:PAS domain S-box-containing protein